MVCCMLMQPLLIHRWFANRGVDIDHIFIHFWVPPLIIWDFPNIKHPHILQYTIIFLTQNCCWWGTPHFWEAKLDSAHWALAYFFSFDGDSCFPNILVRQRGIPGPCISFSGTLILFSEPCIWPNYNRVRPHWNDSMMVSKGKFYLSQCSSLISSYISA